MKILFLGRFALPELGGGEYFINTVLDYLQSLGHECRGACYADPTNFERPFTQEKTLQWRNITVDQLCIRTNRDIYNYIKRISPDVVITQSFDAPTIVDISKQMGIKTVFGVLFWRNICGVKDAYVNMLQRPLETLEMYPEKHRVFTSCDRIYANSEFMQKAVERLVGVHIPTIICPIMDKERVLAKEKNPEFITLINPDKGKGGDLFIEIARSMPDRKFMCVGFGNEISKDNARINRELKNISNVSCVTSTDNMSEIYAKTKILLVPSLVDETFSMCALEGMANAIPVLTSGNGNLPFLVKDGGFHLDTGNISQWADKIETLLNNEEEYNKISFRAKEISEDYDTEIELGKFKHLVED